MRKPAQRTTSAIQRSRSLEWAFVVMMGPYQIVPYGII